MDYLGLIELSETEQLYFDTELSKIDWHKINNLGNIRYIEDNRYMMTIKKDSNNKYICTIDDAMASYEDANKVTYHIFDNSEDLISLLADKFNAKPQITFQKLSNQDTDYFNLLKLSNVDCYHVLKEKYPDLEWVTDCYDDMTSFITHRGKYYIDILLGCDSYYYVVLHEPINSAIRDNMKFRCNGMENVLIVLDMIFTNHDDTSFEMENARRVAIFNDLINSYKR